MHRSIALLLLAFSPIALAQKPLGYNEVNRVYRARITAPAASNLYLNFDTPDIAAMNPPTGCPFVSSQKLAGQNTISFNNPATAPPIVNNQWVQVKWYAKFNNTIPTSADFTDAATPQNRVGRIDRGDLTMLTPSWDGTAVTYTGAGDTRGASVARAQPASYDAEAMFSINVMARYGWQPTPPPSGGTLGSITFAPGETDQAVCEVWSYDTEEEPNTTGIIWTAIRTIRPGNGDANLDSVVDFDDLTVLSQNYNTTGTTWATGDFNNDHATDFNDLVLLSQNYNTFQGFVDYSGVDPSAPAAHASYTPDYLASLVGIPVPEPTGALAALVAVPLFALRRSARRH